MTTSVWVWSLLLLLVALWICCCVTLLLHGFVALLVDVWIFCCVSFVVSSVPFLVTTLCCAGVWGYDYQHMIFVFSPALFVSFFPALFVSFFTLFWAQIVTLFSLILLLLALVSAEFFCWFCAFLVFFLLRVCCLSFADENRYRDFPCFLLLLRKFCLCFLVCMYVFLRWYQRCLVLFILPFWFLDCGSGRGSPLPWPLGPVRWGGELFPAPPLPLYYIFPFPSSPSPPSHCRSHSPRALPSLTTLVRISFPLSLSFGFSSRARSPLSLSLASPLLFQSRLHSPSLTAPHSRSPSNCHSYFSLALPPSHSR